MVDAGHVFLLKDLKLAHMAQEDISRPAVKVFAPEMKDVTRRRALARPVRVAATVIGVDGAVPVRLLPLVVGGAAPAAVGDAEQHGRCLRAPLSTASLAK